MKRTFVYKDEKSDKTWAIELQGTSYTTEYGKTGGTMRSDTNTYESDEVAKKEYERKIESKLKKGYKEVEEAQDASATGSTIESSNNSKKEFSIPEKLQGTGGKELTREEVLKQLEALEFDVVDEIVDFYATQNGTPSDEWFGLYTLEQAINSTKESYDNSGDMFKDLVRDLGLFNLNDWGNSEFFVVINKGVFKGKVYWFIPRDRYSSKLAFRSIRSFLSSIDFVLSDEEALSEDADDSPYTVLSWDFSTSWDLDNFDINHFIEEYNSFEPKQDDINWSAKEFYISCLGQYFNGKEKEIKDDYISKVESSSTDDELKQKLKDVISNA